MIVEVLATRSVWAKLTTSSDGDIFVLYAVVLEIPRSRIRGRFIVIARFAIKAVCAGREYKRCLASVVRKDVVGGKFVRNEFWGGGLRSRCQLVKASQAASCWEVFVGIPRNPFEVLCQSTLTVRDLKIDSSVTHDSRNTPWLAVKSSFSAGAERNCVARNRVTVRHARPDRLARYSYWLWVNEGSPRFIWS